MVKIRAGWLVPASLFCAVVTAAARSRRPPRRPRRRRQDEGMPVRSELVLTKCGGCHKADDKKRMSRISYRRATPGELGAARSGAW